MKDRAVCPYYGCDEEACDVGCGYISPHDAKMIIKFCSSQFCECLKYRELSDRLGDRLPTAASSPPWNGPIPAAGREFPAPAFGLFCFGITAALFSLKQLPVPQPGIYTVALTMILGACGQIITGLSDLRGKPLRAVAFTGFGLFWLSLLAVELLPAAGYGQLPGRLSQAGYFAMWGAFSLILAQGEDSLSRICRLTFSLLTGFLFLLSLAHFSGSVSLQHTAALVGFSCSLPGLIHGTKQGWQELMRLPMPGRPLTQRVGR